MNSPNNYTGPNVAGAPKNVIPDWLDHTANAQKDESRSPAAMADPGPNSVGAVNNADAFLP